jgi:leucyl-tRNA synthetase
MIAVNELYETGCNKREILEPMLILLSPFAPHVAEELWSLLGHSDSISKATFPEYIQSYTVEDTFEYPVAFNGKMRFKLTLKRDLSKSEIEDLVVKSPETLKYIGEGKISKIIVVPNKIINIVF